MFAWPRLVAMALLLLVAYVLVFTHLIIDDRHIDYYRRGYDLHEAKLYDDAIKAYQESLRFNPDYVEAHIMLGNALAAKKRYAESAARFRKALEHISPETEAGLVTKINFNMGNALFRLQRYDDAQRAYAEAAHHNPKHAKAWYGLGLSHERVGEIEEAIEAYENALEAKPKFAEARKRLAELQS